MCSYNRINGVYASENRMLLTRILREQWGFDGLVMSDWGAVYRRPAGVAAGLDLEMPSSGGVTDREIMRAVRAGRLDEAALDALFIEHYAVTSGGRRNISLHSIMQQELGELDPEWSLEQKAAYSALESEFELGGADEDVNLLPGEDDIPREEAVQIAKDAIQACLLYTSPSPRDCS